MIDGLEPSPFLSINTSDLVWHRLPTPAPSERSGSVLSSLSSREPSPQPSSFRSSRQDSERGSITTDEVFSRPPSPLPSALSPTTDKDESTPLSAGEKTSAFFATPFSISTPRLPHDDADAHTGTDYLNSHLTKITGEPSRSSRSKSLKHRKFDEGDTNADDGHSQGSPQHSVSHRVPPSLHLTPHHYRPISRKPSGELDEDHVSQLPSPTSTPIPSRRELVDLNDDPTPRKLSSSPDRSIPLVRHIRGLGHGRTKDPETGDVIGDEQTRLCLLRLLGRGAFSTVWLATDEDGTLGACKPDERPRSQSFARRKGDRKVQGLKPLRSPNTSVSGLRRQFTTVLDERVGEGAMLTAALVVDSVETRVVAVKLMDRAVCATNDRTRISFVREVEVLRHISHPSIVAYLHSFTSPTHHCLVLEYLSGAELFDMVTSDAQYEKVTEPLVRRMFGELSLAVGWMHGVGLVHRDIKLENILLTSNLCSSESSISEALNSPAPIIKLTDFGLSRFIDPISPLLSTRCGSESYAAPEIVMGLKYDGRQTDAWACGVVLYALGAGVLPFELKQLQSASTESTRSLFLRIAKAEYTWPDDPPPHLASEGLRGIVAKLLVRDSTKRAKMVDLWDEDWMNGEGSPRSRVSSTTQNGESKTPDDPSDHTGVLLDGDTISNIARQD